MKKSNLIFNSLFVATTLLIVNKGLADSIQCDLFDHRLSGRSACPGTCKDQAIERLGTKFMLDADKNSVAVYNRGKWYRPDKISKIFKRKNNTLYRIIRKGRFSTVEDKALNRKATGARYTIHHDFVVNDNLTGKVLWHNKGLGANGLGYVPLVAKANCEKTNLNTSVNVAAEQKTCTNDIRKCSRELICSRAVSRTGGKIFWDNKPYNSNHVAEAKRRGLSCGVTKSQKKFPSIVQEVQKELNRIGCYVGTADGLVGPASKRGLKEFAQANKDLPYDISVFRNSKFLKLLKSKRAAFCK